MYKTNYIAMQTISILRIAMHSTKHFFSSAHAYGPLHKEKLAYLVKA